MPKHIIFIVIIEIFEFYVGKWPTLGKFRAVGIYKLLGDGVAIFFTNPLWQAVRLGQGGVTLGMQCIGQAGHWAFGGQDENSKRNNEMLAIM